VVAVKNSARQSSQETEVCSQVFSFFVCLSLSITSRTPFGGALGRPREGENSRRLQGLEMKYSTVRCGVQLTLLTNLLIVTIEI
jgi:hypothetical protein